MEIDDEERIVSGRSEVEDDEDHAATSLGTEDEFDGNQGGDGQLPTEISIDSVEVREAELEDGARQIVSEGVEEIVAGLEDSAGQFVSETVEDGARHMSLETNEVAGTETEGDVEPSVSRSLATQREQTEEQTEESEGKEEMPPEVRADSVTTSLCDPADAGATTLLVCDPEVFSTGMLVTISDESNSENKTIVAVDCDLLSGAWNVMLDSPLNSSYVADATVTARQAVPASSVVSSESSQQAPTIGQDCDSLPSGVGTSSGVLDISSSDATGTLEIGASSFLQKSVGEDPDNSMLDHEEKVGLKRSLERDETDHQDEGAPEAQRAKIEEVESPMAAAEAEARRSLAAQEEAQRLKEEKRQEELCRQARELREASERRAKEQEEQEERERVAAAACLAQEQAERTAHEARERDRQAKREEEAAKIAFEDEADELQVVPREEGTAFAAIDRNRDGTQSIQNMSIEPSTDEVLPVVQKRSLEPESDEEPARKRLRCLCPDEPSLYDLPDLTEAEPLVQPGGSSSSTLVRRRTSFFTNVDEDQVASRQQVEEQAMLAKADLFWGYVKEGNATGVLGEVQKNPHVLCRRGPVGETPLHLLVLFSHFELAKAIATRYPILVVDEYTEPMYRGENCLHIAIVQRDLDMVAFLLETAHANGTLQQLLSARANGDFFAKGTPCFYGEFPLGFAVCTNQAAIVRLLVERYGDSLEQEDSYSNNLLHLAVEHQLPQMYDLIVALWKDWASANAKDMKPLTKRTNAEGFTPLCTAAKYGFATIFNHMLNATCEVQWSYGPVTCLWFPLEDVDYIPGRRSGAVEHIVQEGHLDLLTLPLIQEVLMKKWDSFAKELFIGRFKWALAQAIAYTLMIVFHPPDINIFQITGVAAFDQWLNTVEGGFGVVLVHVICKPFVTVLLAQKLLIEIRELLTEGLENHFDFTGAAIFENTISLGMCCCFFVSQLLDLAGSAWADFMLALTGLLVWSYLLWFMLGLHGTGHLVVMVHNIIIRDMSKFACVTSIFLVSFSLASFIVTTPRAERGWVSFTTHLFDFFHGMISGFDKDQHQSQGSFFMGLLALYSILVTILLLNILIAMMSDTYNKVSEIAEKRWKLELARIIITIEKEMSSAEIEKHNYWIEPTPGERYLQFEKTSTAWATNAR